MARRTGCDSSPAPGCARRSPAAPATPSSSRSVGRRRGDCWPTLPLFGSGTRSHERRSRAVCPRRSRGRGARRRSHRDRRGDRPGLARDLSAGAAAPAVAVPGRHRLLGAVPLRAQPVARELRRPRDLGRALGAGTRPSGRDGRGALDCALPGAAPGGGRLRVCRICAAARPRPVAAGRRAVPALGAGGCARHAARAVAGAGCDRLRRGASRPRRGRRGDSRPCAAALAAPRGVAGALAQPRRVDGGSRFRAAGADERATAVVDDAGSSCRRRSRRRLRGSTAVALARVERLTYTYPGGQRPALDDVSLRVEEREVVCLLGPSGGGKSTFLRALAGLVPHFHGGSFAGRVEVAGLDTRRHRPADLAGRVASVFQDPEDQVVLTGVAAEVEFGLENIGVAPSEIQPRAAGALDLAGARDLAGRRAQEISGGELQRVCLASALALDPELLLLDEPTSQLDPHAVGPILDAAREGRTVVISEQRPGPVLERCDRVVFVDAGRVALDAPRDEALEWLMEYRPVFLHKSQLVTKADASGSDLALVARADGVSYAYGERHAVGPVDLELRRGEIVALVRPNGSGKTTLAKLAAGLLEPRSGSVMLRGRAGYLSQDPGRYLVCERADEEVALGVGGDLERARRALAELDLAGLEGRHPRDLSSGQRERLALAAVLVTDPDVLILDEPTRGVDPERKAELAELLEDARDRRATLVVTQDAVFAADVADRTIDLAAEREPAYA